MPEAQALLTDTHQPKKSVTKRHRKIDDVKLVELWNKDLSVKELAEYFDCDHSAISHRLTKLIGTSEERKRLALFEANKHHALIKLQQKIVAILTKDGSKKLEDLPGDKLAWTFGTLEHNKRLLAGQSTSNVSHLMVVKKIDEDHYQGKGKDNEDLPKSS